MKIILSVKTLCILISDAKNENLQIILTGWLRSTFGRMPVFGGRTDRPALGLQLTGDHYVGKPSAVGQPTRPPQPFILPGSINE